MTDAADIVVVGLGPAGARAARRAAEAGFKVIALDRRAAAGTPVQCAEFVPAMLGQELSALDGVTRQYIKSMLSFVEDDDPDEKTDFPGRMIDRRAFDARLVEDATRTGANCRFNVKVDAVLPDGQVRLSGGETISARVVIGADGPRSRVGRALGRENADVVETRQITVPLLSPHEATDIFLSERYPGGYGWLFPKGETANLGVGVAADARHALRELLDDLHERLVDEGRVGEDVLGFTGGPIPVGGRLDPVGRLGNVPVLLAGDAAGLANPVTGAGIASAVISGTLAGEAAAAWLGGDEDALTDYEDELAALFDRALARALKRRKQLLAAYKRGGPTPTDLRNGWIGYAPYWTDEEIPRKATRTTHDLLEA